MKAANPTARDLRRINRQTVFRHLYQDGPMSRLELGQLSGLSAGTIANVVGELLAEELVLEAGFEASEGGRPRTILTLNMEYGYFLGGEIGETEMVVELFDVTLQKLQSTKYLLTPEENNPIHVAERFAQIVTQLLAETGMPQEKILGLGVGVPGIVEQAAQETVYAPAWDWQPVRFQTLLSKHLQIPLSIDNGAKAMALAEMHREPDMRDETIVALNVGTGAGAGIIYEGKLFRGGNNGAGEWGHTTMVLDGERCRCGRQGCLEAYIGAPGMLRQLRERKPAEARTEDQDQTLLIHDLCLAAQQGEPLARQVVMDTLHYLGAGMANLVNLINPQRMILGGWIGLLLGEYFLPELLQIVERYSLKQSFDSVTIQVSQIGEDAVSLGAARLVLETFLSHVGKPNNPVSALRPGIRSSASRSSAQVP
jgi:predicted NBD/HSP70 family sugar kinase